MFIELRRGDISALQYEEIDFENDLIHITRYVSYDGNKPYIKPPKTQM